jgi:hypothetical protein
MRIGLLCFIPPVYRMDSHERVAEHPNQRITNGTGKEINIRHSFNTPTPNMVVLHACGRYMVWWSRGVTLSTGFRSVGNTFQ